MGFDDKGTRLMEGIYFVKMRNDQGELYPSYIDYWKLVELSGFRTCELNEVDRDSDNVYIFSPVNGNTIAWMQSPHKARFICWQLERPNKQDATCREYGIKSVGEMWVSDRALAEACNCTYVPMGGHPDLVKMTNDPCGEYDFVHMAYLYGERKAKVDALAREGYKIAPASFKNRDSILMKSKYGLCLHQDEFPTIEPLRYTLFACACLPIFAEKSDDFYPYKVFDISEIGKYSEDFMFDISNYNNKLLTEELTFKNCVLNALQ